MNFAIWTMNLAVPLFLLVTLSSAGMIQDERSHSTKFQIEFQTLATNTMRGWRFLSLFLQHLKIISLELLLELLTTAVFDS